MEVPETNPWARPPPPKAAEPPPASADTGSSKSAPGPSASSRSVQHAPAKPAKADIAPLSPQEASLEQDPPEGVTPGEPAAKVPPPSNARSKRCACCNACCNACGCCLLAIHRVLTSSPALTGAFVGLVALASLGLFAYSCSLLQASPTAGSCGSNACSAPGIIQERGKCLAALAAGSSCSDVCATQALSGFVPFRFAIPGLADSEYVMCPFPAYNSNWRIPLSLFEALLCVISLVMLGRGWYKWTVLALIDVLVFCGAGMYFYVMCIDAVAVRAGQLACAAGFPGMGRVPLTGLLAPTCDDVPLYVVPLLDGLLCPLLAYCALVLRGRRLDIHAGVLVRAAVAEAKATRTTAAKGDSSGQPIPAFTGDDPEYAAKAAERAAEAEEARGRFKAQQQSSEGGGGRPAFQ